MPNMDKETHFVMRNGKAEYPSVAQENLLVWYDAKGKHNPDRHKDTLLDLSGNNRHAELYNFAYEKKSGYLDNPEGGLLFDDVDDKLIYPSVKDEVEYTSASRNLIREIKASGDVTIAFDGNTFVFSKTDGKNGIIGRGTDNLGLNQFSSNTQYTLSGYFEVVTGGFYFGFHYTDGTMKYNRLVTGTNFSFSTESGKTLAYISWYVDLYQYSGKITNFQLEEGSTATPYTPYVPLPVMTYQYNGNILSYEADGTVKRVDDGKVITRKGINLVRNGNFYNGMKEWSFYQNPPKVSGNKATFHRTGTAEKDIISLQNHNIALTDNSKIYLSLDINIKTMSGNPVVMNNGGSKDYFFYLGSLGEGTHHLGKVFHVIDFAYLYINSSYGSNFEVTNIQIIDLTATFGAGNEPTIEEIQAHPEEFAWTPNPNDLIEAHEIKNNLVGDLEDLHGTGDKTEILSGAGEVFTDKADDDSVVHVEIDGKSIQPHRFREESGESLVLTNHAEDKPRKLEVLGNTFQNAGSGKNLFNFNSITRTVNSSLLITEVESNGFTVESTNTTSWQTIVWELDSVLEPNKTYTIKFPFKLLSGNITDSYAQFSLDRKLIGSLVERTDSFIGTFQTGELIKGVSKLTINFHINGISNVVLKKVQFYNIQLEEGPTATAYEPPAPSPDYPIEMKSVGEGLELYGGIGGRNLARSSLINHLPSKMIDGEDYWVVKGISSGNASSITLKDMFKENTQYTFQFLGIATTYFNMFRINYADGGVSTVKTFKSGSLDSITSDPNRTIKFITIDTGSTAAEGYVRKNTFKIEEGSTATPYTPAPEDVPLNTTQNGVFRTKPNLTAPLRKVGDVADRLFWDSTAGKWKVERRVGEIEIATKGHSWTWLKGVSSNPDYYYFYRTQDSLGMTGERRRIYSGISPLKSNRLRVLSPRPYVSVSEEAIVPWSDLTSFIFVLHKTRLGELTDANINAWFEANPTTILYELETPVTETLEGGQLPPLFSPTSYLDTISEVKGQLTAGYRLKEGVTPESSDILVAPEYVNPIHSVNDFDVVSSVEKKNLFSITGLPWNSTNLTLEEDGTFTSQANNSSLAIFSMHKLNVPVGKTYTASFEVMILDNAIQFSNNTVYINGASPSSTHNRPTLIKDEWVKVYTTFNYTIENTRTVHIYFNQGLNLPIGKVKFRYFKVEKGFTATDWTPAPEDITESDTHPLIDKTNILLSEPLRSVGDVKDRLFRDSDGLWKVERNVHSITFKDTTGEKWYFSANSTESRANPEFDLVRNGYPKAVGSITSVEISSTHFLMGKASIPRNYEGRISTGTYLMFSVPKTKYPDVNSWKNMLNQNNSKGTPVTVQYQVETPTIETLDQELQDKLNNIRSFQDSNYLYTIVDKTNILPSYVRDNLKPNLNAKFRKLSWFWSRLLFNQLKIWKRNLTDSELLHEWIQNKKRWGM